MEEKNIPRGQLPTIILSTLLDGDKYGLEIINTIKDKTNNVINLKQPTLYSSLTRMEKQGYISSYWLESKIGGKRHYYRITDLGKKQFNTQENTFFTEIIQKSPVSPEIIEQNQKYDEIEQFQKTNELDITNNNTNQESSSQNPTPIKNIDLELRNLNINTESFSENLKTHNPTINLSDMQNNNKENIIEENIETPKIDEYVLPTQSVDEDTQEQLEKQNDDIDDIEPNLPPEDVANPTQTNELSSNENTSNKLNDNEENEPTKKIQENNNGGIFIQEKYEPDEIPVVKKIEVSHLETTISSNPTSSKLHPNSLNTYQDKINELYDKAKPQTEDNADYTTYSYDQLDDYYKTKEIKFGVFGKKCIKQQPNISEKIITNKSLLIKSFTIFLLVIFESLACGLGFYFAKGFVDYPLAYFIIPCIFSIMPIYLLISKKEKTSIIYDKKSIILSIFIFLIAIVLLFALNMLIDMNISNIMNYETTFIYPCLLATNIIVVSCLNYNLNNKK